MKKVLLLAVAILTSTAVFSQSGKTAIVREDAKTFNKVFSQSVVDKSRVVAELGFSSLRRADSENESLDSIFFLPQEGVYYGYGTLSTGDPYTSVIVPSFVPFKFENYCTKKENATWLIGGEKADPDENGDLDYSMSKGRSPYSLYSAPTLQVGDSVYSVVGFVQPMDSMLYQLGNVNTEYVTNYYYTNGSYFMTEDISYDFDGDGVKEDFKCSGIRQYFEKPITPLSLHEIRLPLYSSKLAPVPNGLSLKAIIRRVVVNEEGKWERKDTLAVMEAKPEDIIQGNSGKKLGTSNYYYFNAYFASYVEDEFGTQTANPVLIDDMFCIDILGFDGKDVEINLFAGDLANDPGIWSAGRELPTYIVLNDLNGEQFERTLSYYNRSKGYGIEAEIFLIGEMDGINMNYNTQIAPVAGGASVSDGEGDDAGNPVYLFTTFPMFIQEGTDYAWSENYDFEGIPEWAELKIDPTYYENEQYTNVRGLHMVWFECQPLPEGVTGRYATVKVTSARGAHAEEDILLIQGDATITGVNAMKFDANGKFVGSTFNLAGQRVNDNFKGLVIKNGRKFMNK